MYIIRFFSLISKEKQPTNILFTQFFRPSSASVHCQFLSQEEMAVV